MEEDSFKRRRSLAVAEFRHHPDIELIDSLPWHQDEKFRVRISGNGNGEMAFYGDMKEKIKWLGFELMSVSEKEDGVELSFESIVDREDIENYHENIKRN